MAFGILWVNKRFLKYIKPLNPKKDIKLADSKLKTKKLLKNLDIPYPKLIDVIKNRKQLKNYDFSKLYWQDFVVKPNKWSKWKWIMICSIKKLNDIFFVKVGDKLLSQDEFKKYLVDILDWKYSLTLWNDIILIEEKIEPSDEFKIFCEYWLADIRLIVMNLVPVMGMLRYPTLKSWWKANIAVWWVWFWIDIWTWKIVSMYRDGIIYIKTFPKEYQQFYNKTIPYWDDILLYSSQIQYFTNIWYLWLDWVISKKWPMLLEINARAWMEIQLVNWEWLEKRLRKIHDLQINLPSKWVEVWKTLFSKKNTNPTVKKNIIYLEQPWFIREENQSKDFDKSITIKVDLDNKYNYWDPDLVEENKKYVLKFWDIILDDIKILPKKGLKNTVTLWTLELEDFIIVPKKKDIRNFSIWTKKSYNEAEENSLIELDNLLDNLSKKLNLSKIVKPKNYMEELDNFITWNGNYNPKFVYKYPSDKKIQQIGDELKQIEENFFDIKSEYKSELFSLFREKLKELKYKLDLVKAYKNQDFKSISKYNKLLFGELNEDYLKESKNKVSPFNENYDLWRKLFLFEVIEKVKEHLKKRNIQWKVVLENDLSARILIKRWEPLIVAISKNAVFYEKEINMVLAHEVDVHATRYLNWKNTWWKILQSWTGFYLKDEEWLAIWNSFNYLPENYEKNAMYEKYLLIYQAQNNDFVGLANLLRFLHPQDSLLKIFRRAMRFKRWVQNTAFKWEWTVYFKDKIYLDGYKKVSKWLESWGSFKDMLKWKYKIEDLKYINLE